MGQKRGKIITTDGRDERSTKIVQQLQRRTNYTASEINAYTDAFVKVLGKKNFSFRTFLYFTLFTVDDEIAECRVYFLHFRDCLGDKLRPV